MQACAHEPLLLKAIPDVCTCIRSNSDALQSNCDCSDEAERFKQLIELHPPICCSKMLTDRKTTEPMSLTAITAALCVMMIGIMLMIPHLTEKLMKDGV